MEVTLMETLRDVMGQTYHHQLPIGTLLQDLEHHMQDLLEEMGGLSVEGEQDALIAILIWGETGEVRED